MTVAGARVWPDSRALLDETAALMAGAGQSLSLRSAKDLEAELAPGPLAEAHGEGDLFDLAALLFEGVATRHAPVDGDKRLAFLAMVAFLTLNGAYLDAPEAELAHLCIAVAARVRTPADLAACLRAHC